MSYLPKWCGPFVTCDSARFRTSLLRLLSWNNSLAAVYLRSAWWWTEWFINQWLAPPKWMLHFTSHLTAYHHLIPPIITCVSSFFVLLFSSLFQFTVWPTGYHVRLCESGRVVSLHGSRSPTSWDATRLWCPRRKLQFEWQTFGQLPPKWNRLELHQQKSQNWEMRTKKPFHPHPFFHPKNQWFAGQAQSHFRCKLRSGSSQSLCRGPLSSCPPVGPKEVARSRPFLKLCSPWVVWQLETWWGAVKNCLNRTFPEFRKKSNTSNKTWLKVSEFRKFGIKNEQNEKNLRCLGRVKSLPSSRWWSAWTKPETWPSLRAPGRHNSFVTTGDALPFRCFVINQRCFVYVSLEVAPIYLLNCMFLLLIWWYFMMFWFVFFVLLMCRYAIDIQRVWRGYRTWSTSSRLTAWLSFEVDERWWKHKQWRPWEHLECIKPFSEVHLKKKTKNLKTMGSIKV